MGADEVVNDSLLQGDEVLDGSLTGVDIDESTLNLAPVSTTTFAGIRAQSRWLPNSAS